MTRYTKKEAISIVVKCAKLYKKELENKTLLFFYIKDDGEISYAEFSLFDKNYLHLTGLKSSDECKLTGRHFYQKCIKHKLRISDFSFSDDGTTFLKLELLPNIICKNLHANIIGDYNSSKKKLKTEKIVGNVDGCMGFIFNSKSSKFVPNTILKESVNGLVLNCMQVIATYRKSFDDEQYEELTYKSEEVDWSTVKFPEEFSYLQISDDADGAGS